MIGKLKLKLKHLIAPVFAPLYRGRGSILMFHRILPTNARPRVHTNALDVTPERLEEIILFFRSKEYDFIKMDQVSEYLREKKKNQFVVFTFDDGYVDNYTKAYPVFKKYNIPFTVYLTTDMPDYKMILWHYMLEDLMLRNNKLSIKIQGELQQLDISESKNKESVYNEIRRHLIDLTKEKREKKIEELFFSQEKELVNRVKKEAMSWEQIEEMSNDPLVEIGAHTVSHPSLATLTQEEILREVNDCCDIIQKHTSKRPKHFAYPFGSKNEIDVREIGVLGLTSMETAVTTREANLMKGHKDHLHALPRIYIGPKTSIKDLDLFTSGITPFVRNTFNRLIIY